VSIAFDERAPILEANTIRVFTRLTAYRGDPVKSAGQKFLWSVAEEVLPERDIARFNQALMELGSLVCTPTAPKCDVCPVNTLCEARRAGAVDELAATTKKLKFESVQEAAVIVRKGTKILVRQCGPTERWSGLWDFPRFECDSAKQIAAKLTAQTGVTRFRISLDCYTAQHQSGRLAGPHLAWRTVDEIAALPLSVTGRRIVKLLERS
jgi:A/G-specific adenine glycosylase